MLHISWDEAKNKINQDKHKLDFELAKLVFEDPLHLMRQDRIENGEQRWQTLGMVNGLAIVLVAHTWIDDDGEEYIRIISARPALKRERKEYEENC
jgi:uncharacterized protein